MSLMHDLLITIYGPLLNAGAIVCCVDLIDSRLGAIATREFKEGQPKLGVSYDGIVNTLEGPIFVRFLPAIACLRFLRAAFACLS